MVPEGARWSRMVRDGSRRVHDWAGCDAWWGRVVLWCRVVPCGEMGAAHTAVRTRHDVSGPKWCVARDCPDDDNPDDARTTPLPLQVCVLVANTKNGRSSLHQTVRLHVCCYVIFRLLGRCADRALRGFGGGGQLRFADIGVGQIVVGIMFCLEPLFIAVHDKMIASQGSE